MLHSVRSAVEVGICALFLLPATYAQSSRDRELYDTPELWSQLSSAKRNLLELKFGRKAPFEQMPAGDKGKIPFVHDPAEGHGPFSAVNTLVNDAAADATAQDTQSETALVLGVGSTVIAGFNDSGSYIGGATKFTGYSRSTDGGNTWVDGGTLPTNPSGDAGDPVLARSASTGTVFLATLSFNTAQNLDLFRSTTNGSSWLSPVNSAPGFTSTTGSHDKEWIAGDNVAGSGYGNVYQFWRNFGSPGGMTFTRSTDDGVTWIPSGGLTLASGGQGASVVVGIDHAVYCFWLSGTSIVMRKSTNQGVTFASAVTVTTLNTTGVNGDLGLGGGFRTNAFPQAAVNPVSGNLYIVYNDKSGSDKGNVYFQQSTNGGTTWSAKTLVNDDGTTNDQWQPAMAVKPDGTGLGISWYDRRSDPSNSLIDRWAVTAAISGSTVSFFANMNIGPQFPVVVGVDPVVNSTYMGDYDQMAADNEYYYTTWGDNRDQSIAVPARKNANVRIAKFQAPTGPVLQFVSASVTGGNGNGTIDPNEMNNVTVTVTNAGIQTSMSTMGTITTSTPEVSIAQGVSSFPDIGVGGTGSNAIPFQIATTPSFVCGTPVNFKLLMTYSGGSDSMSFSLPSGSGSGIPTVFSNNVDTRIPPSGSSGTTQIPITVSGISSIGKITVALYLTHSYDSDLIISLISPDATTVVLSNRRGGGGSNYGNSCNLQANRTTFDDAAATPIGSGSAPFVGSFRPEQALSAFVGKSGSQVNGTWTLQIDDAAFFDSGFFHCVDLFIAPATCTDGGLPIQLASFTGTTTGTGDVLLDWTTLSEVNNYGFEIQKSEHVSGPFSSLPNAFIPGHGTTNIPQHYNFTDTSSAGGRWYYRLKQIDYDNTVLYSDPIQIDVLTAVVNQQRPTEFSLDQNYPNPFNPSTVIRYGLPATSDVRLEIYDMLGQSVSVLVEAKQEAGLHQYIFENGGLPSGVYFYCLRAQGKGGSFVATKKFILVK